MLLPFLQQAKEAKSVVATLSTAKKNSVLRKMAQALRNNSATIESANALDMEEGVKNGLSNALLDRLKLDEKRIGAMATSLEEIAMLKDPVGRVIEGWMSETGLKIEKTAIPIGVVATIYESRPNVTSDVAGLCFKSGNVALLKGGKEALCSNTAIATILQEVLEAEGLSKACISMIPDPSREGVLELLKRDDYIDLVIPRGGEALIKTVVEHSRIPVVKHDKGLCHVYVDQYADTAKALAIVLNAKVQRPGVCNAMETLLVHENIAATFLPLMYEVLHSQGVKFKGCSRTCTIIAVDEADEEAFHTEYLDLLMNVKVVAGTDEAIGHIAHYGSGHSDAIVSENYTQVQKFTQGVDSACVYVNASTRFTDGGAFGFGAEVGISTNKLHARGPMGIAELTTYKYCVFGEGHIRS